MERRVVSRRALLASLIGVGAAGAAVAQQTLPPSSPGVVQLQPDPLVVSGSEFGFRVDRVRRDGIRVGTLVVKDGDRWVEAEIGYGLRRGT